MCDFYPELSMNLYHKDQLEISHNFLIEHTPKAVFQALNSSLKPSRPLLGVLKTDQEAIA